MTDDADLLRRRRCLGLQVAIVFGVLLPILHRSWITFAVAVVGVVLALVTYWRVCRDGGETKAERSGTHSRESRR